MSNNNADRENNLDIDSTDNVSTNNKNGVLPPMSLAFQVAHAYFTYFVILMLVADKTITKDGAIIPATIIYFVITAIKYFFFKNDKDLPRWFMLTSFFVSVGIACIMVVIL